MGQASSSSGVKLCPPGMYSFILLLLHLFIKPIFDACLIWAQWWTHTVSKKGQPRSSQDRHTQGISPPFSLGLTEVLGISTFGAGWQESDGHCPHLQSHWLPYSRDSHASLSVWMSTKAPDLSLGEPTPGPTQLHPAPVSADLNPFFVPSSHHDSSCFRGKKRFTSGRAVESVCFLLCSSFCI